MSFCKVSLSAFHTIVVVYVCVCVYIYMFIFLFILLFVSSFYISLICFPLCPLLVSLPSPFFIYLP
ncbi:hypothetical protein BDB01DRAFT_811864 [Pilobolus umbonatus]|nr:hypothetical protein BDB01DRAFT_811864 [Pilobolus umbonatus]